MDCTSKNTQNLTTISDAATLAPGTTASYLTYLNSLLTGLLASIPAPLYLFSTQRSQELLKTQVGHVTTSHGHGCPSHLEWNPESFLGRKTPITWPLDSLPVHLPLLCSNHTGLPASPQALHALSLLVTSAPTTAILKTLGLRGHGRAEQGPMCASESLPLMARNT